MAMAKSPPDDEPDRDAAVAGRRQFLRLAACGLGGGLGLAVAAPALRLFASPSGETTVTSPSAPIEVGALARIPLDVPTRVPIVAPTIADAWTSAQHVVLGAAWVHRKSATQVAVFSAVCPHLGCGIGFANGQYGCPCHDSVFDLAGNPLRGPAKRGLDSLSWDVVDGRLRIAWVKYALDTGDKVPA